MRYLYLNSFVYLPSLSIFSLGSLSSYAYFYILLFITLSFFSIVPVFLNSHSSEYIVAPLNTSCTLYCTFSGKPAPRVTWYRMVGNSFKMISSTKTILVTNTSVSMLEKKVVFENVKKFDDGMYRCSAVNAAGEYAKNITLNVTCKYPLSFLLKAML